ncbi:MAG: hypothetical protein FWE31_04050 [Firmicutes bacterium]|nr:hypothetical protein [Bacillota bacterium]
MENKLTTKTVGENCDPFCQHLKLGSAGLMGQLFCTSGEKAFDIGESFLGGWGGTSTLAEILETTRVYKGAPCTNMDID